MPSSPVIAVVGSLNVDHTFHLTRLPKPGETVMAKGGMTSFGGKGANQAVAAVRAGGQVRMIGCVGNDDHGRRYRAHLAAEGIDTAGVVTADSVPTGSAFISVDDEGENCIVVNPGANHALREEDVEELGPLLEDADAVLLQLECPLPTVARVAALARRSGTIVILNPSPWMDAVRDAGIAADVLIVNESEARSLTGRQGGEISDDGDSVLAGAECRTLIVTRGAQPTLVISEREEMFRSPPPVVTPVDTVGAGDTFAGAFAVAHGRGASLRDAVDFANAAASLATLKPGAQAAIPRRDEIREFAGLGREREVC